MESLSVTTTRAFDGFEHHYLPLTRFAYLLTGNPDVARDLAHEALVRAVEAAVDLNAPRAGAYLRVTLANLWKRHHRRLGGEARSLHRLRSESRGSRGDQSQPVEDRAVLFPALLSLPPAWRLCIVLRYYEDWTLRDIADELGAPIGTVKSRIHKSLRRLQKALGEQT